MSRFTKIGRRLTGHAAQVMTGVVAGAGLLLASMSASAMLAGKTPRGQAFATGGVSVEELSSLYAGREKFNLWIVTAAMGSGAHLADVRVVIRDAEGQTVYDDRLQGPWLFIDLPRGRYQIDASVGQERHQRVTTIHAGDLHQAFFYFDTGDQLAPEYRAPFPGSPYSGARR